MNGRTADLLGVRTREIRYTQLLRYFFDPNELHGLGSKVLLAVLEPEWRRSGHRFNNIEWHKAKVEAEFNLGSVNTEKRTIGCAVDLFLQFSDYVLENKILIFFIIFDKFIIIILYQILIKIIHTPIISIYLFYFFY